MSRSVATTGRPAAANRLTVSDPTRPKPPVTSTVSDIRLLLLTNRLRSPEPSRCRPVSEHRGSPPLGDSCASVNVGQHCDVQLVGITPHRHSEGDGRRKQPEIGRPRHVRPKCSYLPRT